MARERDLRKRSTPAPNPHLVGRSRVLDDSSTWLREAQAGDLRIVLIEGPPGIGKTAVFGEVLRQAADAGAQVLASACREDVAIPYLPVATALAPLTQTGSTSAFAMSPGLGGSLEPGQDAEPSIGTISAPREELGRHLAVIESLAEAARNRPVVLALDDLHWADDSTIELLGHVAAAASYSAAFDSARFLMLATSRPNEGSAAVQHGIARLAREPGARRLTLSGLDELETNELLTRLAPRAPSPRLLEIVLKGTNGNPLMVRLLLERLLETGDAFVENGRLTCAPHEEMAAIPAELDGALRRVLDRVSAPARELLIDAALLGDGANISELVAVSGRTEAAIEPLLDELDDARVLSSDGLRYRFAHPQLRHVASQLPTARQRQALHGRLADRLESHYGAAAGEHAMAIAGHLERAGPRVDAERLGRWARLAGNEAFLLGAWSEASRHYDTAIAAAEGATTDARLFFLAALGHHRNHDIPACLARLEQATALARASNDLEIWGSSVALTARAHSAHTGEAVGTLMDLAPFEEFLTHTIGQVPALRCQLLAQMAEACFAAFDTDRGMPLAEQARALADELGEDLLISLASFAQGLLHLARLEFRDAALRFSESTTHATAAGDAWYEPLGTIRLALVEWSRGELDAADAHGVAGSELTRHVADWAEFSLAATCRVGVAVARGRFAEAERLAESAEQGYLRSSYAFTPPLLYSSLSWARAQRGDLAGAGAALDEWERSQVPAHDVFRLACEALVDGTATGIGQFGGLIEHLRGARPDLFTAGYVVALAEAADLAGEGGLAAALFEPLDTLVWAGMIFCPFGSLFVPRLAGVAALRSGDLEQADRQLVGAERLAAVSPVELARVRLDRARVAFAADDTDPVATRALLLAASSTFDEYGMLPMLARAQALAQPLIEPGTTLTAATRYLLVTDIVDSTGLNLRAGDQRWIELIREHNQLVRQRLRKHDGVQFKHTGDGICAWFSSAASAVECALGMIGDLGRHNLLHPQYEIRIRCGVASGTPIGEGDDLFGISVALASRLCGIASTNEVLVADDVARAARGQDLRFEAAEAVSLRGFPEKIVVRRVSPRPETGGHNT